MVTIRRYQLLTGSSLESRWWFPCRVLTFNDKCSKCVFVFCLSAAIRPTVSASLIANYLPHALTPTLNVSIMGHTSDATTINTELCTTAAARHLQRCHCDNAIVCIVISQNARCHHTQFALSCNK